jgi:hypothetical protein
METMLWIIYWVGVVLFPILVGILFGKDIKWKELDMYDVFDSFIPIGMLAFVWPIVLIVLLTMGSVVLVGILFGMFGMVLSTIGYAIGRTIGTDKKKDKKESK